MVHNFKTKNIINKKLLTVAIIILLASIGIFFFYWPYWKKNRSILYNKHTQQAQQQVASERLIYNGIPTRLRFIAPSDDKKTNEILIEGAWKEFERIGFVVNPFSASSEVGKLNNKYKNVNDNDLVKASEDLIKLIKYSLQINSATDGAFDPTIWPIKALWSKASVRNQLPSKLELKNTLQSVGIQRMVTLHSLNQLQFHHPQVKLDFGGIAKGYAVDQVRLYLQKNNVRELFIQCGGEIVGQSMDIGRDNNKRLWKIAIQHPKDLNSYWGIIEAQGNIRASTSGNYRQPIMIQGKEYYHIFNPKTAWPVPNKILSVTLVSFSDSITNATIDALTKSILVLGEKEGMEIVKKFGIEALIIVERGDNLIEIVSEGLVKHYRRL